MANCLPDRASGVLLHVTSLPGPSGIGELGKDASVFLNWLKQAGQRYWQLLPIGPTGYGESPYQLLSSYAGNPLLIAAVAPPLCKGVPTIAVLTPQGCGLS